MTDTKPTHLKSDCLTPIVIGGVGGSGTRVVAHLLEKFGYHIGSDLNNSRDNLWFTLLFNKPSMLASTDSEFAAATNLFVEAMNPQRGEGLSLFDSAKLERESAGHFDLEWSRERISKLGEALAPKSQATNRRWAWKEPNAHIFVDRLAQHIPRLRYVHVVRDGRDMALSRNKNQLRRWAKPMFGLCFEDDESPRAALRYWRRANERIFSMAEKGSFPILEVGFESLCSTPFTTIKAIAKFSGNPVPEFAAAEALSELVKPPPTLGRHRNVDPSIFDSEDYEFARATTCRLSNIQLDT